jgi:hypothetical protein
MTTQANQDKTPEDVGNDLIVMMNSLTLILEKETAALKNKQMDDVKDASREKVKLLREYQKSLIFVANNSVMLKRLDAETKTRLREARVTCEAAARKNQASLKGALTATQNLIELIVKAAVKGAQKMDSYTDPRTKKFELGTHNPVCDPVAFCRNV